MPNHVTNEIIFRDISLKQRYAIIGKTLNEENKVDFEKLLPIPINCWMGSVSVKHEQAFKHTALDWCRNNWGTKWNAYSCAPIDIEANPLTFVFDTAWRPPYGWLVALFNTFKVSFDHNWFDEGQMHAHSARFDWAQMESENIFGDPWKEEVADDATYCRFHQMMFNMTPEEMAAEE